MRSLLVAVLFFLAAGPVRADSGPWNLKALFNPPPVKVLKEDPGLFTLTYGNVPYQGKPTQVFAYLAIPQGSKGPHPAMVLVHGGGGTAFREWALLWANRGYVALAMDLAGSTPEKQRLPEAGPGQDDGTKFKEGPVEDAWTYHAVAAVIHGVSLLRERKEVDPERIGITGISWGGYLTCIVAGLDTRLKVAVPVYGCGYLAENSVWKARHFDTWPAERKEAWLKNFGPEQFVGQAKMPVLFVNGTNDFAYPLDSYRKTYRLVTNRTLAITKELPHSHPDGWKPLEIGAFVDQHLKNAPSLASFGAVQREASKVQATFKPGGSPVKTAQLVFTTDSGEWQKRKWHTTDLKVEDGRIRAELPTGRPLVWFLTITDERGLTVSTEHEELK